MMTKDIYQTERELQVDLVRLFEKSAYNSARSLAIDLIHNPASQRLLNRHLADSADSRATDLIDRLESLTQGPTS
jgi:hypothetical protein